MHHSYIKSQSFDRRYNADVNTEYDLATIIRDMYPSDRLDGRESIMSMHDDEAATGVRTNWRQMEWFGWYSEFLANGLHDVTRSRRRFSTGSGSWMNFDYEYDSMLFDLKTATSSNGKTITNDLHAIREAITLDGVMTFVVVHGTPVMDDDGSFMQWHDALKGKQTVYERASRANGRPRRMRKAAIVLDAVKIYRLDANAVAAMPIMRQGRNENGRPRPVKMLLDESAITPAAIARFR